MDPSPNKSVDLRAETFVGNDKVLFGIIFGVLAFWLFAQTTLNIAPVMAEDLGVASSVMNIAVSITALFSGIFIVVMGGCPIGWGESGYCNGASCSALPVPFWWALRPAAPWPMVFCSWAGSSKDCPQPASCPPVWP